MGRIKRFLAAGLFGLATASIIGCSNQQVYEAIQYANQQECQRNPEFTREKCLRQVSQSYRDYAADRAATVEDAR